MREDQIIGGFIGCKADGGAFETSMPLTLRSALEA
jgi:hypothetical protein